MSQKIHARIVVLFSLIMCLTGLSSLAQDAYRPLKAGNPNFHESQLKPEVRDWYRKFWAACNTSIPGAELDAASYAKSGDNFEMGRPFEMHMTALLMAYRLTGDLKILDEVDRLMQLARGKLRDAWDNGQTDGFLNWRDYKQTPTADKGKDITRPIDEIMLSGMLAEVAWAFRVNQGMTSPKGINYKERADFWQNYLSNHWEKKIRKREGKSATAFPFTKKAINHVFVAFAKYHYYMSKLTGRTDYMNEANRMFATLKKNVCVVPGPNGNVWMWPHMVYYDITSSDSFSGPNDTTCPPMTTYIRHSMSTMISLHMEGVGPFKDNASMKLYTAPMRDFMLDGGTPMVARSLGGEVTRTGILNGVSRKLVPIPPPPKTTYGRVEEYNWASSAQMVAAVWDSTAKLHKANERAYAKVQYWWADNPRHIFLPVAMMWYGHTKPATTHPYPPTLSKPTVVSHSQLNLSWTDNSSNESGFRIQRSTAKDSGYVQIASLPANTTKFSDTGLKMGTRYYYRIYAFNSYGTSPFYGEPKYNTTKKSAPAAPSNLIAYSPTSTSIKLEWSDNSDNETSFRIEKRKDGQTWSGLATVGANVKAYTHSGLVKGTKFYYRVRAQNGVGNSSYTPEKSAIVGQTPPPTTAVNNSPTVSVSIASATTYIAPANIALSATAADSDGSVTKVEFRNGTTVIGSDTTSPYSFTWSNVAAGTYSITARAYDDDGAITTSSAVSVTVSAAVNQAPTVSLTSPTSGATLTAPASIAFAASASDVDGSVTKVEFLNGTTAVGSDTAAPYAFTWSNVPAGTYSLTARATDNNGASKTSTAISVTVSAPVNVPPTASITSPAEGTILTAPSNIAITASMSDSDGTIVKTEYLNYANVYSTRSGAVTSMTWPSMKVGTYSISVRVTDDKGAVTTSPAVTITLVKPVALLVTQSVPASSDLIVQQRLESLGFVVEFKADSVVQSGDTAGKSIVVVSSNSASGAVGTRLQGISVPVLCWEPYLFDDFKMTSTGVETGYGWTGGENSIVMNGAVHPLSAGLTGTQTIYSSAGTMSWGRPAASAVVLASLGSDSTKPAIFGYEAGASMSGLTAPARRVGICLGKEGPDLLTAQGWSLFDAAVKWTSGQL
jgi:hypothetical protein